MPLTICLETEIGVKLDEVFDLQDVVTQLTSEGTSAQLMSVSTIDPYGDTTLNRLQIPSLLQDLQLLLARADSPEKSQVLQQIEMLARRCLQEPHLYLKFYGD